MNREEVLVWCAGQSKGMELLWLNHGTREPNPLARKNLE